MSQQIATEILDALRAAKTGKGLYSAAKLERWVRSRFQCDLKRCDGCGEWLTPSAYTRATGYKLGLAKRCRECERLAVQCPEGCRQPSGNSGELPSADT